MPDINLGELTLGDSKVLAAQERVTKGFGKITSKITDLAAVEEAASKIIVKALNDEKRVLESLIKKRAELGEVARGTLDAEIKQSAAKVSVLEAQVKGTEKLTKTTSEYERQVSKLQNRLRGLVTGFVLGMGIQAVVAIGKAIASLFEASEVTQRLRKATEEYAKGVGKAAVENDALFDRLRRLNPESLSYAQALKEINEKFKSFKDLNPGATIEDIAIAQRLANIETNEAIRLQTLQKINAEAQADLISSEINLRSETTGGNILAFGKALSIAEKIEEVTRDEITALEIRADKVREVGLAEELVAKTQKDLDKANEEFKEKADGLAKKRAEKAKNAAKQAAEDLQRQRDELARLSASNITDEETRLLTQLEVETKIRVLKAEAEITDKTLLNETLTAIEVDYQQKVDEITDKAAKDKKDKQDKEAKQLQTHLDNLAQIRINAIEDDEERALAQEAHDAKIRQREAGVNIKDETVRAETITALEDESAKVRGDIVEDFAEKRRKLTEEALQKEKQAFENLRDGAVDLAGALSDLLESQAGENEKFAEFQKALALFQIAVNTASAVSSAIKGAAGLPFPANLAAIAGSVAAVLAAIAQAKAILSDSGDVPKFAKGTERFKGGLAMVGEKGKELVFLPPNSAIANNQATTKYTKQIKAMNEGKWEQLITEMYLKPALQGLTNQFNNELAKVIHKEHDTDRRQGAMNTGLLRKALRRHYNPRD